MIEATNDDNYEDYGPSLAYPPLYVLRAAVYCPECGQAQHVYTLGCESYRHAEDGGEPIDQFHFLNRIENVPTALLDLLRAKLPGYYLDHTRSGEPPYLMKPLPVRRQAR